MTNSFLKLATEGNKNAILKQQIICQYILCGDSSITDLSKAVNLSVPTVTKLIGELIDEGFVHNFGEQGTAGGRRPNIYGLNPYAGYFIGVDIRKDSVVMAAINFKGQLIDETTVAFQMDNDPHSLDKLCEVILNFVRSHKITRDKVLAIGVNISGRVNSQTGYSYSYFFVEEQPLTMLLEERLGTTVYIENDTRAATYGEYMYGDAHNEQDDALHQCQLGPGSGHDYRRQDLLRQVGLFGGVRTLPAARQRDHLPLRQARVPRDGRFGLGPAPHLPREAPGRGACRCSRRSSRRGWRSRSTTSSTPCSRRMCWPSRCSIRWATRWARPSRD